MGYWNIYCLKYSPNVHFQKIVKREIFKYPENFHKDLADNAFHHGQEAAREKYQVNNSSMSEFIAFYHRPISCNEFGKPFPCTHDLEKHMSLCIWRLRTFWTKMKRKRRPWGWRRRQLSISGGRVQWCRWENYENDVVIDRKHGMESLMIYYLF